MRMLSGSWTVWEVNAGGNGEYSSLRGASSLASRISLRIFILEGLLTIAMSIVAIFLVPTWPQKVKWVWETASRGL